ncbi:protein kinase [bacterium]|nr:protein kinase [bacterium]
MSSDSGEQKRRSSKSSGSVRTVNPGGFLKTGQVLGGNYEVHEQIGEGGMAIVYRATQKSLNRSVAIKALHPKFARDKEFIARFEAESGSLASLSHPNIVSIIERGCENEIYYFVMEYVDGPNLDEKIIGKMLTPNDWRQIVTSCASALEYVHKRGVVHRDIKPSNVLIDSEGRVKLGDFGIAHLMHGNVEAVNSARAVGTAHYMAPEQIHDPANVDLRVDVYALGVTFYKMLARQLPIGEYPAPSEANREVPVAVDAVIFQAMAPNRDDRFQTVKDFCDEMTRALKDSTANISSILNYRPQGSSALYTGQDFRTPVPSTGSSPENKKPSTDPGTKSKTGTGTGPKTGTGTGVGSRSSNPLTPVAGASRTASAKAATPVPLKKGSGSGVAAAPAEEPPSPKPPLDKRPLVIGVAAAILLGLIVTLVMILQESGTGSRPKPVDPAAPITQERSNAAEREARIRQDLEQQQRDLLEKNKSATTATPAPTATTAITETPDGAITTQDQ